MYFSRRRLIKSSIALAVGLSVPEFIRGEALIGDDAIKETDRIPLKGEEFNESFLFPDECTNRPVRRLTSNRQFNHKSTYHIKSGFSGKYLVFCTYNDDGNESALIRADAETGDLKVLDHTSPGDKYHFSDGNCIAMVPMTNLVAVTSGDRYILYNIFTGEKREYPFVSVKKNDTGCGVPSGTCDGKYLLFPYNHHEMDFNDPLKSDMRSKYVGTSLYKLEIETGKMTEVFRDDTCINNHVIANPANPEYCLIDRDFPPLFGSFGDNGKTTRVWSVHIPSAKLTEIRPNDKNRRAIHSNWNSDGTHIYYHGRSGEKSLKEIYEEKGMKNFVSPYRQDPKPHFIGVADINGKVIWEGHYPIFTYGHIASHSTKDILFVDNLLTDRHILALYWRELNLFGMPRTEMVFAHNSIYLTGPHSQACHTHCTMSDDGKWISYNACMNGRTDVYVAQME